MYIEDSREIASWMAQATSDGRFGIDLEFIRERTYYPKLALIQISVGDDLALIDPLADLELGPLIETIDDPKAEFAFDVTFCHFVDLTQRLGRNHLAPLFCLADSVYFGQEDVDIRLDRDTTLAGGDDRCRFRFAFRKGQDGQNSTIGHV